MNKKFDKINAMLQAANPEYIIEYDEKAMQQVSEQNYARGTKFVYVEEYLEGNYNKKYFRKRETKMQLWFCRFTTAPNNISERNRIRQEIEEEIVFPFIENYDRSKSFGPIEDYRFQFHPPRFDANEISVMLEFNVIENAC